MSKHTPGAWEVISGHNFITIVAADNKPPVVCRIKNEVTPQKLTGEDHANARLIAAAPDLLEALEKLARLGNGDQYGNSEGNMIARAAIAKATGE